MILLVCKQENLHKIKKLITKVSNKKREMSIRTSKMTFEGQPENVIFFVRTRGARISVV